MSSLNPTIEYKIILIGNSGVGKTSFFRKLSTGEFAETNIATIGVEKISFDINIITDKNEKKKIDVSLFDTAGQEKFRALTRQYYKGTDGVLLLYDITDRKSFENVEMWIDSLNESIDSNKDSKYVVILIGNKKDLINVENFSRQVSEEEGMALKERFKNSHNIFFYESSALTGYNIDEIFIDLCTKVCNLIEKGEELKGIKEYSFVN